MILGFVQNSFFRKQNRVTFSKARELEWVAFHMNKTVFLKTNFELEKDLWV